MASREDLRFDLFADLQESGDVSDETIVGLGHARRVLVLAASLHEEGVKLRCFFENPQLAKSMFHSRFNYKFNGLFSCPSIPFLDWRTILDSENDLTDRNNDMLIIDSYRVHALPNFLRRRYRHIACFHDDKPAPSFSTIAICPSLANTLSEDNCNTTINSLIDNPINSYSPLRLQGGAYFPFDKSLIKESQQDSQRVVIWFGGNENGDKILPIIQELLRDSGITDFSFDIVISPNITPNRLLLAEAEQRAQTGRLRIHHDMASMSLLLSCCAIYIGGAGVTSCEAALLGLRLILCALTANQHDTATAFSRAGAALFDATIPSTITKALIDIREEPQKTIDFAYLHFDKFGASRLSNTLCDISLDKYN